MKTAPTTADLKAIPGKTWVHAVYKKDDEETILIDEQAWLPVRTFPEGVVPATAWASADKTYQVKQFEPLKISMGCSLPCLPEEKDAALEEAFSTVMALFIPSLEKVKGLMKVKGL